MKDSEMVTLHSKQQLKLEIELIINKNLYNSNKISKDTYLSVEQNLLRDIAKII